MKKFYLCTMFLGIISNVISQSQVKRCGFDDYINYLKTAEPDWYYNYFKMQNDLLNSNSSLNFNQQVITIPVVVHIVYENMKEYVPVEKVLELIDDLNTGFRKWNADTSNIPAVWKPLASDMEIQFCLAQRDPQGNPTCGIVYKKTTVSSFTTDDKVKFSSQGGSNAWDPTKYFNIWVCDLPGLLGYAKPPPSSSSTFGVVLAYQTVLKNSPPYNLNKTVIHEVGHCFTLLHTFGSGPGCSDDDGVSDTPLEDDAVYGCPTFPKTDNCSPNPPGVMFYNYMDYSDDNCLVLFTSGQKTRAWNAINNAFYQFSNLINSDKCKPVANFSYEYNPAVAGCPIKFSISCVQKTLHTFYWDFGNGLTSNLPDPLITYSSPGSYNVKLVITNPKGADSIVKTIQVNSAPYPSDTLNYPFPGPQAKLTAPSGCWGYRAGNNCQNHVEKANYFKIENYQICPFENICGALVKFAVAYQITPNTYIKIKVYNASSLNGPPLSSPIYTDSLPFSTIVNDVNNGKITTFKFSNPVNKSLISISNGFFVSIELPLTAGDTLAIYTVQHEAVYPSSSWEKLSTGIWRRTDILSGQWYYYGTHYIAPIFCKWPLYVENNLPYENSLIIYPNPFGDDLNILDAKNALIYVYDVTGKIIYSQPMYSQLIDLNYLSPGIYFLRITPIDATKKISFFKIIKNP